MYRYEKYKPTGIDWIGEIPIHWDLRRIKYEVEYVKGKNPKEQTFEENGKPYLSMEYLRSKPKHIYYIEDYKNYFCVNENEILLLWDGSNAGEFLKSKAGVLSSTMAVLNVRFVDSNFAWYFFKAYEKELKESTIGMGIPHVNGQDFKNQYLIIPPTEEQIKISNYLDEKTELIEKHISNKQKLIELFNEEKNALVDEVVTKGIEISVKKKYSGIEWIGDIPKHWGIKKLRYLGINQNGISKGAEYFGSGFPFLSYGDVYNNDTIPEEITGLAQSSDKDRFSYSVSEGDIFFTRTSETVEEIGIASVCMKTVPNAIFSGFLIRFRPFEGILYKGFSKYYFRSQLHRKYFVKEMNLVTRASLSQDLLKNLPVLIPPFDEQIEISNYLDERTAEINKTISKIEKEIELMLEYRTALISEVVTGKIFIN